MPETAASGRRTAEAPRRMSLSEVLELLLTRGSSEHSSVTLTRNSRGETQIEVTVRTGESGEVLTAADAAEHARTIYDDLRVKYPHGTAPADDGAAPR